jgi:Cu(I)/Ag(I) efflux system membrane fusion protein
MCKTRIETAAKSLNGVRSALWDQETKNLKVTYDDKKTSTQQIQTSIAIIGHDTQLFSANDKKYAELPGCCNYKRDGNRKKMTHSVTLNECDHDINASKGSCCETK